MKGGAEILLFVGCGKFFCDMWLELIPFFLLLLSTMIYGQNDKIVKMHETIFSSKFHGHMFTFLSYFVLKNKRKRKDKKKVNKKKNKVITQLLEACVSLSISNASILSFFI